jgi:subfamily B ATP-binding cassette protein MsbA
MFFDRTNQGYLTMVMNYSDYTMRLLEILEKAVYDISTLIFYSIIMILVSWKLMLITIFVFPILNFSLKLIINELHKVARLRNEAWTILNRNVFNILSCIPLVKAYSREEETKEKYSMINEQLRNLDFKSERMWRLIEPLRELIITLALLIMIVIIVFLFAKRKTEEISVFVVFFYAARKSLPMFNIFNELKANFARAKPPLKELSKVFDDRDKFFVIEGNKTFQGLTNYIEFKNLNFSYIPQVPVLKDVNFQIEKGKVTALVGPTGSGKTTLVSLLMRFYDCPPSSIFIDGEDIKGFTSKSLRQHMALVSQEVLLFNDTLRNNLVFGLDKKITEESLVNIAQKAQIYDYIMHLPNSFDTEIGDRGVRLSGGEKQRVAIARALLKGSEILILDEATSSLDSKTEQLIQQAINEAIKGRTAIVIAHRLSTIKNAHKIVVIEGGRIFEEVSLNELLERKGKFYEYWEAQKFY